MTRPRLLVHDADCPCAGRGRGQTDGWVDAGGGWPGDEYYCTCDLKERIRDARATDTNTIALPFEGSIDGA